MIRKVVGLVVVSALLAGTASAQDAGVAWKRSSPPVTPPLRLFHSTQGISLPTAETLGKGVLQFEISHRFDQPFSDGYDALYGLDGTVAMRLGLGYSPTDRSLITLARSNRGANVDLQGKYEILRLPNSIIPMKGALQVGGAWNTLKRFDRIRGDARNFQYYAQAIIDAMYSKRVAVGVVPGYLHNSNIEASSFEDLVTVGLHAQVYLTHMLSLLAEWTPRVSGDAALPHRPVSFGLELETGGHFFKLVATNSVYLNPAQYMSGSEYVFGAKELRFGFLITRLLRT